MANLKFKDENGNWVSIPSIQGEPGKDGKDGHTPIKGVDYFTQSEINEIVNEILNKIPSSEGVGY